MKHILEREDRVMFNRALNQLNNWIAEYAKQNKQAHPFYIVGQHKEPEIDRRPTKNQ